VQGPYQKVILNGNLLIYNELKKFALGILLSAFGTMTANMPLWRSLFLFGITNATLAGLSEFHDPEHYLGKMIRLRAGF